MTLEERIEAATKALFKATTYSGYNEETLRAEWSRTAGLNRRYVDHVLRAAFPELFTDAPSAWLAPWSPTDHMAAHGEEVTDFVLPEGFDNSQAGRQREMRMAFEMMRDSHLSTLKGEKFPEEKIE